MTVESTIQNFQLETLTISVGTTVRWTNQDGVSHTTSSGSNGVWDNSGWDKAVAPGASAEATFDTAGTFTYTCTIHPFMNATITVE